MKFLNLFLISIDFNKENLFLLLYKKFLSDVTKISGFIDYCIAYCLMFIKIFRYIKGWDLSKLHSKILVCIIIYH